MTYEEVFVYDTINHLAEHLEEKHGPKFAILFLKRAMRIAQTEIDFLKSFGENDKEWDALAKKEYTDGYFSEEARRVVKDLTIPFGG